MGYKYITPEQRDRADNVNLAEFLQLRGERLERTGSDYKLIYSDGGGLHDSINITGSKWFDFKNGRGGGPINFVTEFYGKSYPEAVEMLLGAALPDATLHYRSAASSFTPKEKKPFELPKAHTDMRRVFAYLTKTRYISGDIVSFFAKEKKIYQSVKEYPDKTTGEPRRAYNLVFVGKDKEGNPKQANFRSIVTDGSFRGTVESSDTNYSFNHIGTSNQVFVFEAAIDMLSFISLYPENWKQHSYVNLDGCSEKALTRLLEDYPHIRVPVICTDNDEAGINAAERMRDILYEKGYTDIKRALSYNKDWNEDLKALHGAEAIPAQPHAYKEEMHRLVSGFTPSPNTISPNFRELYSAGRYGELANNALNICVDMLKLADGNIDFNDMFEKLSGRIERQYRAYNEKGKIQAKTDSLGVLVKGLYRHKNENLKEVAKKYFDAAEAALKLQTKINVDTPAIVQTETPIPSMM